MNGIIHVLGWCMSALELQQQLHSTLLKVISQPACVVFLYFKRLECLHLSFCLKKLQIVGQN